MNTYWQTTSALISMNCLPSVQIFLSLWAKHLVLFMHLLFHWMPNLSWVSLYLLFFMCLCVHPRVDVNSTEKRGVQSEAMSLRGMSLLLHEKPCLHSGDFQVFTVIVWVGCRCVTSHRGIFFFQFFHHDFKLHFHQAKPTLLSHLSGGDILGIYSHEKKKKSWSAIIHFGAI